MKSVRGVKSAHLFYTQLCEGRSKSVGSIG